MPSQLKAGAAPSERPILWTPIPGPQTKFLASTAYEVLFGGQCGGSKSESLLVAPLRWVHEPSFRGILLRRSFPELEKSLIERSAQLYPNGFPGTRYNEQKKVWIFPSGARIYFGHLERDADVHNYQSAEFQFLGFDELTSFTEKQYVYMLSRARSSKGLPVRVRAATNPGGVGHDWVFRRWGPWLDPSSPVRAEPDEVLWYVNSGDGEQYVPKGTANALARCFMPARLADNPHLLEHDPAYAERLRGLDALTRAQLLDGNWLAKPARGLLFKRTWLPLTELMPLKGFRVRYWDRAASTAGDWTVGLRMSKADGVYTVEDVVRFRGTPHEVEANILATADLDGKTVMVGIEQDPGQAGKFEASYYVRNLAGYNVRTFRVRHDKVTRAQPVSAQAEAGNVRLVRARWNDALIQELEAFPEGGHDDQVDALSGAFAALSGGSAPALDPRFRQFAPRMRM